MDSVIEFIVQLVFILLWWVAVPLAVLVLAVGIVHRVWRALDRDDEKVVDLK